MCLYSMCCIYVSAITDDVGAPRLTCQFVYGIAGKIGSSSVSSLFAVCALFPYVYSCELLSCPQVYC